MSWLPLITVVLSGAVGYFIHQAGYRQGRRHAYRHALDVVPLLLVMRESRRKQGAANDARN